MKKQFVGYILAMVGILNVFVSPLANGEGGMAFRGTLIEPPPVQLMMVAVLK
jgi:hypothetical protein